MDRQVDYYMKLLPCKPKKHTNFQPYFSTFYSNFDQQNIIHPANAESSGMEFFKVPTSKIQRQTYIIIVDKGGHGSEGKQTRENERPVEISKGSHIRS
jgi:hypothetical protein